MNKLKIIIAKDDRLKKKAMQVTVFDENLKAFAQDMITTASQGSTVGLSSIQVEDDSRFSFQEIPKGYRAQGNVVYIKAPKEQFIAINAQLIECSDETEMDIEACVSIPNIYAKIERSKKITVQFQDLDGIQHTRQLSGFIARIFQHEIDHANGILYPSRLPKFKQPVFWNEYGKNKLKTI